MFIREYVMKWFDENKKYIIRNNIFNKENRNKLCYIDDGSCQCFCSSLNSVVSHNNSKKRTDKNQKRSCPIPNSHINI